MNKKVASLRTANNITLLRHFAAFFVLISHSFDLTGNFNDEFLRKISGHAISFSRIGLIIFFFISGFLITQSLVSSTSIKHFIWKRFLRIYPALIMLGILTVFILGPLFTTIPVKQYFASPETWEYLFGTSLIRLRFFLPGVFHGEGVNGSLWTLPVEFRLYLLLALLSIIGFIKRRVLFFVFVFLFIGFAIFAITSNLQSNVWIYLTPYLSWGMYFLTGSFVFFIKDKIILDYRILILFLVLWFLVRNTEIVNMVSEIICFSYFTLWMSFKTPVVFSNFFKENDFSYSMYLYTYPLQQIIIFQNSNITPWMLILFTSMAIIPFCWLSWNLVEKPSLKLKRLKM
ncbi:MAG TPA: acyltransferase [Hanamia sp.]|nr:acyltransferase [Hanamia sp.]